VVDPQAVTRRLLALTEALRELERPEARDARSLATDAVLRAAVERWLQVAIEACIDVADHVIAEHAWTPPETGRAAFQTLAAHGLLELELASRLGRAVGLCNLLVHDYTSIDVDRLARIVAGDLDDLRAFGRVASGWLAQG
jgi:uncharacterized protein YutE (UPF0331/DUF86 family)